jgi:hypothetical protein
MKKWLLCVIWIAVPVLATAQSLRCGQKIIGQGATRAEVGALCGEPAQVDHKSVYRSAAVATGGQPSVIGGTTVEVQVEVWTYNFGPTKLMQRIRFEDGTVVRIESLGYGY